MSSLRSSIWFKYSGWRDRVSIGPAGIANSSGTRAAGADAKEAPKPEGPAATEGALTVAVDPQQGDLEKIRKALMDVGATDVRLRSPGDPQMSGLKHPVTPDGRYFVVRGKLWRMSDPSLDPEKKLRLVKELMTARSAVKTAKAAKGLEAEAEAHRRVDLAKRAPWANADRSGGRMTRRTSTGTW
jgi:hypothetical protein